MPLKPGFMVVHGNHPESLRDLMLAWMAQHPLEPLEDELVLVQSNGVAQWLKLSMAAPAAQGGTGVAAALRTELPSRALWGLYRAVLGEVPVVSALDKSQLIWRLMRLLPRHLDEPVFEPLRGFLAEDGDMRKRHQLALRLADLLDQYQVYRADWLAAWARGEDLLPSATGPGREVPEPLRWQPRLWRLLLQDVGPQGGASSRAEVHRRFLAQAPLVSVRPAGVPRRIVVFGISSLPLQSLQALHAVSRWTQVLLCVHNPCEHDWSQIVSEQDLLRRRRQQRRPGLRGEPAGGAALHAQTQPLLAAWGRQGRDFIRLLDEHDQREAYEQEFQAIGRRIDLFEPNAQDTLLRQLQDDIRELRPLAETRDLWPPVDPRRDRSIGFHVAHGPQREVEVLHDQLLAAFTADPALRPRDVIVMVPDVEAYAPHIQAVFGLLDAADSRHIPFGVADQGARRQDPLLRALELLLNLPQSRLGVGDVLDLLDLPDLRIRFGIAEHDLPLLRLWIDAAGVRWGLHAQHREHLDLPAGSEQNGWRFGLRRMWLGYASGGGQAWNGIEPLAGVGGLDAALLGPLVRLLDALEFHWRELSTPATPAGWGQRLHALLHDFLEPAGGDPPGLSLMRAQEALAEWVQDCAGAAFDEAVPLTVVREHWLDRLEPPGLRQPFFGGGVTFASLMPMRAIPFRWVALLGMNDGDYPRARAPVDFDLMAHEHRPGDRSRREDDRYLFLEALLSAREHLHLSWVGRSIQDNQERPPSVLLAQLRDHLAAGWRSTLPTQDGENPGSALVRALTLEHRLQPFHPVYFRDKGPQDDPRHLSYAHEWRATLAAPGGPAAAGHPLPIIAQPVQDLRLLGSFVRKPVKAFFEQRLDVRLTTQDAAALDQEPFTVDALENWQLQDELIRVQRAAIEQGRDRGEALDAQLARIARRGELPHGAFAQLAQEALGGPMEALFGAYTEALQAWPRRIDDAPLRLEALSLQPPLVLLDWLDGLRTDEAGQQRCRLVLESSGIVQQQPRGWRHDKLLPHWIAHLAAHRAGMALHTCIVSKAGVARLPPLEAQAVDIAWTSLLEAWSLGMRRPLRYSVDTACAWLKAAGHADKAREAVAKCHATDLERDPCFARAWPDFDAFWDDGQEIGRWATGLVLPLQTALGSQVVPPTAQQPAGD